MAAAGAGLRDADAGGGLPGQPGDLAAAVDVGSNGAIKQAARAGLGVALQSRAAVELELELGLVETISPRGGLPERRWHVVRSAVGPVREEVEAFMAFCRSPAAKHALAKPLR